MTASGRPPSGKAEFTHPDVLSALGVGDAPGRYHLITMRSNDQFNTTIYGFSDRLRGLEGSRMILLINPADMAREGLAAGELVSLITDAGDDVHRQVPGPDGHTLRSARWVRRRLLSRDECPRAALVSRQGVKDAGLEGGAGSYSAFLRPSGHPVRHRSALAASTPAASESSPGNPSR